MQTGSLQCDKCFLKKSLELVQHSLFDVSRMIPSFWCFPSWDQFPPLSPMNMPHWWILFWYVSASISCVIVILSHLCRRLWNRLFVKKSYDWLIDWLIDWSFCSSLFLVSSFSSLLSSNFFVSLQRCDWCHGPVEVFDTYVTFVSSLLASQPTYADSCLRNIIWRFRTVPLDMKPDLNSNSFRFIDDKLKAYCERIHAVLARVVHIVPLWVILVAVPCQNIIIHYGLRWSWLHVFLCWVRFSEACGNY